MKNNRFKKLPHKITIGEKYKPAMEIKNVNSRDLKTLVKPKGQISIVEKLKNQPEEEDNLLSEY